MAFFVLAGSATETNQGLVSAAWRLGVQAALVRPRDVLRLVSDDDTVLARLDVRPSLDGMEDGIEVVRLLEQERARALGVRLLNPASALAAAHDKLLTAITLAGAGVPQPRTAYVDDGSPLPRFRTPVVVKPRFGSWGHDVFRCDDWEELRNCLRDLRKRTWFREQGALVQELVPTMGFDLRLIVAAGEVVGAVRRVPAPGEWRTNVALGAERHPVEPLAEECRIALKAAEALGADLVGIDLLPTVDGRYVVLELNGAVEFTPQYALNGSDVFEQIVSGFVPSRVPAGAPRGATPRVAIATSAS
jgi:RimK family alpha-L-glutamate ligase